MTKQLWEIFSFCASFLVELATYHFATEANHDIEPDMPFRLLGVTQLQNAAKLIHRMDQTHSLLDQFLVAMPLALGPTREQLDQTCKRVNEMALSDFKPPFDSIFDAHTQVYQLDDETAQLHWDLQHDFSAEVRKF